MSNSHSGGQSDQPANLATKNPISAADWDKLLKDKNSLVWKELANAEDEEGMRLLFLEKILEQITAEWVREDRMERLAIIQDWDKATLMVHKLMQASAEQQADIQLKKAILATLPPEETKKRMDELSASISVKEADCKIFERVLADVKIEIAEANKEWKDNQKAQAEKLVEYLKNLSPEDKQFYEKVYYKDETGKDCERLQACSVLTEEKIERIKTQCQAVSMEDLFKVNKDMLSRVGDFVAEGAGKIVDKVAAVADFGNILKVTREAVMEPDDFYYKVSKTQVREAEPADAFCPSIAYLQRLRENKPKIEKIVAGIVPVEKAAIRKCCGLKLIEQREKERLAALKEQIRLEKAEMQALQQLESVKTLLNSGEIKASKPAEPAKPAVAEEDEQLKRPGSKNDEESQLGRTPKGISK